MALYDSSDLADWFERAESTKYVDGKDYFIECHSLARDGPHTIDLRFKLRPKSDREVLLNSQTVPALTGDRANTAIFSRSRYMEQWKHLECLRDGK